MLVGARRAQRRGEAAGAADRRERAAPAPSRPPRRGVRASWSPVIGRPVSRGSWGRGPMADAAKRSAERNHGAPSNGAASALSTGRVPPSRRRSIRTRREDLQTDGAGRGPPTACQPRAAPHLVPSGARRRAGRSPDRPVDQRDPAGEGRRRTAASRRCPAHPGNRISEAEPETMPRTLGDMKDRLLATDPADERPTHASFGPTPTHDERRQTVTVESRPAAACGYGVCREGERGCCSTGCGVDGGIAAYS